MILGEVEIVNNLVEKYTLSNFLDNENISEIKVI